MTNSDLPDSVDPEQIQQILRYVLEAEEDKLHMGNPIGINEDIKKIIEREIK